MIFMQLHCFYLQISTNKLFHLQFSAYPLLKSAYPIAVFYIPHVEINTQKNNKVYYRKFIKRIECRYFAN